MALLAVVLAWNIWLTQKVFNTPETTEPVQDTSETVVVETKVTDFTSGISETVKNAQSKVVTVHTDANEVEKTASGIIYTVEADDVYIFTTYEVLASSESAMVTYDNGVNVLGEVIGLDEDTGLGLIKTQPGFEATAFTISDSDLLDQGENVIAMGCRRKETSSSMVSYGVVSSTGEKRISNNRGWMANVIETDAIITNENFGGPLMNVGGEMVGICLTRTNTQERMGYALSTNELKYIYSELKEQGEVVRGVLGITVRNISEMRTYEKSANGISLDRTNGVFVTNIPEGSACAGILNYGDLLTAMDGSRITDKNDLRRKLYEHMTGDPVVLTVIRDGQEIQVDVVLL